MTRRDYTIVDVFTDVPLQGNALAVFADGSGLGGELMQRVARELNLSETVFVLGADREDADARLRIFTPTAELPFAGHPVLGTAFVLAARSGAGRLRLQTGAGVIPVALRRDGDVIAYGEMDQPIPTVESFEPADDLLAALGVARSELPIEAYRNGPRHIYVALSSEQAVHALRPNMTALTDLGDQLGISCFAGRGGRVKTRMFAPALGVPEDPATGSAAGPLALHLVRHGWARYGERFEIHQGAETARPSTLYAGVEGSAARIDRVFVGGSAVIVATGEYRLQ
jgi:trans-2,3-dihydro-3-hydroxyanthranilate isomerase